MEKKNEEYIYYEYYLRELGASFFYRKRSLYIIIFSITDLWKLSNAINADVISYFYMNHLSSLHAVIIVINAQYRRDAGANLLS